MTIHMGTAARPGSKTCDTGKVLSSGRARRRASGPGIGAGPPASRGGCRGARDACPRACGDRPARLRSVDRFALSVPCFSREFLSVHLAVLQSEDPAATLPWS